MRFLPRLTTGAFRIIIMKFIIATLVCILAVSYCNKTPIDTPSAKEHDKPVVRVTEGEGSVLYEGDAARLAFRVDGGDVVEDVRCSQAEGVVSTVTLSRDGRSGWLDVEMTPECGSDTVNLELTAITGYVADNAGATLVTDRDSAGVQTFVRKAYLRAASPSLDSVPWTGGRIELPIEADVDLTADVDKDGSQFFSVVLDNGRAYAEVSLNDNVTYRRRGKVTLSDTRNLLEPVTITLQQLPKTFEFNADTDWQAFCTVVREQVPSADFSNVNRESYRFFDAGFTFVNGRVTDIITGGADIDYRSTGHFPPELFWFTEARRLELTTGRHTGPLPKGMGNMKSLKKLDMASGSQPRFNKYFEKLDDSSIEEVIGQLNYLYIQDCAYGSVPAWLAKGTKLKEITLFNNHLSGQIPDEVARMEIMQKNVNIIMSWTEDENLQPLHYCTYENIPMVEAIICTQRNNYALWVGERPSNTKWVQNDGRGGHWEWTSWPKPKNADGSTAEPTWVDYEDTETYGPGYNW